VIKGKKVIAVIPARGGSKGIPNKNIKDFHGKPLIAWTIKTALESEYIDEVCVSTDSEKILETSKLFGVDPKFKRPAELAKDDSTTIEVLFHALDEYKKIGKNFDIIICLEPTSPIREKKDIDEGLKFFIDNPDAWSLASVTEAKDISLLASIESNFLSWYKTAPNFYDRHKNNKLYCLEGTVLLSWVDKLIENQGFYHEKTLALDVPRWKSTDIDDLVDWYQAEGVIKNLEEIKNEKR
tara:strand:- start:2084 stop:2800 length:717 start_codon:yes stop_codon:yes gene_type:complete